MSNLKDQFIRKFKKSSSKNNSERFFSSKRLGSFIESGKTGFRLFAPAARSVSLIIYNSHEDEAGTRFPMNMDNEGVWELFLDQELTGKFYNYVLVRKRSHKEIICFDPYAKAFASFNSYFTPRKSIVLKDDEYDWEGDKWIQRDWRDLIIYEMHIKDMTAHRTSEAENPGTYKGLIERTIRGGIDYIKSLGVNTIELLPLQEFANIEIPFNSHYKGFYNTWNPYERNHWGYMTAGFFAPDELYSEKEFVLEKWSGFEAKQVNELKDVVKEFHKEGIAVIMDVVYNHTSIYESGGIMALDKEYYLRHDEKGNLIAHSGCGNDFKTESLMARRMIIDSVLFWMNEYHIDGFRFDLGRLIDWETIEEVIREARKINPHVIFICEPWGGGYDPAGFSLRGWASWNDQIRNGIKGENPFHGKGWIFGKWFGNNDPLRIQSYVSGTLTKSPHGLFQKKEHSVNYLESHDGYTLGDFIRLSLRNVKADEVIQDPSAFVKLTPLQMNLNKLAALFLLTSQGIIMIHSGQEFARTKIIYKDKDVTDPHAGMLDHNSYNKDNDTNYINYDHSLINEELLTYYKELIRIRKKYEALRHADYDEIRFIGFNNHPFALGYTIHFKETEMLALFNADRNKQLNFRLPEGEWTTLADAESASAEGKGTLSGNVVLDPSTALLLLRYSRTTSL